MRTLLSQDPETWDAAIERYRRRLKGLESADAYLDALRAVGWTADWADARVDALRGRLNAAWERSPRMLYVFPALADVSFDTEGFVSGGDYVQLVERLAAATGGRLPVTGVSAETGPTDDAVEIALSFAVGDAVYEERFTQADDWVASAPFEMFERALDGAGAPERFVTLPTADQILSAAFVDPAAFERALTDGLVPNAVVVM